MSGTVHLLPTTVDEVRALGWDGLDVVLVTGDAYVDHPSFGAAVIGRVLAARGFTVGILAQPDVKDPGCMTALGRPRLFFGVTAGNLDSVLANRTSRGRRRSRDAYSPGGRPGLRPDRATIAYTQRIRESWPDAVVVLGGIEASLRRLAHYDFASGKVRGSILLDSGADLLVYGMGEAQVVEIAHRLASGEPVRSIRDVRGTAVKLDRAQLEAYASCPSSDPSDGFAVLLPSFEQVVRDPLALMTLTQEALAETNPHNARDLVQGHGPAGVLVNAPAWPLSTAFLDEVHELPFTREQHPAYALPVPALETVRHSITIMRGCVAGCSFCALSLHQGRLVTSRSEKSVVGEASALASTRGFGGTVTDLGGPTANLYGARCREDERMSRCRRTSCLSPRRCKHLDTDPGRLLSLMRAVREVPGVARALVASGVRMDVALDQPGYVEQLAAHHVGGQLSVAPEHVSARVLGLMGKPRIDVTERFMERFARASREAGLEQYVVPYLMSGHPGSGLAEMVEAALWLAGRGLRPRQVQQFVPTPMTLSTAMYHAGVHPVSGDPIHVPRDDREQRLQKALLVAWDPSVADLVRQALLEAGRADLVGPGGLVGRGR